MTRIAAGCFNSRSSSLASSGARDALLTPPVNVMYG
jgi:hypothetical protein